jgi:RibD C-terminal domain
MAPSEADTDVPLPTIESLSVARRLMRAGLVDRLRLMIFPLTAGGRTARGVLREHGFCRP